MTRTDIAGLVAPIVGAGVLVAAHFLAPATMAEIMFWCGVVGSALVGVANRYASPPKGRTPLPPGNLNTLALVLLSSSLIGGSAVVLPGCSALSPAVAPTAEASECVIVRALGGESVTQIATDCGGIAEQAVADILNGLLAKDLSLPPADGGRAMARHALTPSQRATISVTLNAYDSEIKVH